VDEMCGLFKARRTRCSEEVEKVFGGKNLWRKLSSRDEESGLKDGRIE